MQKDQDNGFPTQGYQLPYPCPSGSTGIQESNNLLGPWTDLTAEEGICLLENEL